jgi:hypothetical protein
MLVSVALVAIKSSKRFIRCKLEGRIDERPVALARIRLPAEVKQEQRLSQKNAAESQRNSALTRSKTGHFRQNSQMWPNHYIVELCG